MANQIIKDANGNQYEVVKEKLPVYWGSYLVNNVPDSLEDKEEGVIEDTLKWIHLEKSMCIVVLDDASFCEPVTLHWLDAGDFATYIFHKPISPLLEKELMKYYYIVQGKERDFSADDSFTYNYSGDFSFEELKHKVLLDYCKDEGFEKASDGKFYTDSEQFDEIEIDIWDIFKSDTPITRLVDTTIEEDLTV